MFRMRWLLLALVVMCGQVGLAGDVEATHAFVGCYELRIEGRPRVDYGNQFLPKRFELKAEHAFGGFAVKNLDSRVRSDLPLSSWHLKDDGSISLVWSTGYVGWQIHLSRSGGDLRGTAHFFTDTGSETRPSRVITRTVRCSDTSDKS